VVTSMPFELDGGKRHSEFKRNIKYLNGRSGGIRTRDP
jgi:hypothetical protein